MKKNNISKNNNSRKQTFFEFLKSKEIRKELYMAALGMIIVIFASNFIENKNVTFVVNFIGIALVFSASDNFIKKMPKG
ncbi:MAG: hypothetical protein HGA49_11320 [Eubacteriaceae bacterium]|nr:hypothetical protein [Eubacteriaceae bacterium]